MGRSAHSSGPSLEALKGTRKGWHGIRINDQWRVCCRWIEGDDHDVHVVDGHRHQRVTVKCLPNIHPGEGLLKDFLKLPGISRNALARASGLPSRYIN